MRGTDGVWDAGNKWGVSSDLESSVQSIYTSAIIPSLSQGCLKAVVVPGPARIPSLPQCYNLLREGDG